MSDPVTPTNAAPHDPPVEDAFAQYMSTRWAPPSGQLPPLAEVASYAARRRRALANAFAGKSLVIPTGNPKVRANDTDYTFRPGTDFFWLTGCHEPNAVLLIVPAEDDDARAVLFLADRSDRATSAFYRDRRYGELWVGPRLGVAETQAALGISCRPIEELEGALAALEGPETLVLRGFDALVDGCVAVSNSEQDTALATALSEMRLVKDHFEVCQLRSAVAATAAGFDESIRELANAQTKERGERWIEGTFWRQARTDGNDVGYVSIVACGHHATTLHWVTNDGPIRPGDMVLLDMGVESDQLYTADITRTLPINGHFSKAQRQVYDLVYAAQRAAIDEVKPGAHFMAPHRAAMKVIAEGLEAWGVLPVSAEESLKPDSGLHRRYTLHSVSHMLGIDVHDCANASTDAYYNGILKEGMVLTVEPGLYFQIDDETAPVELRGLGVRIEDDVLVTASGCEVISGGLPTQADEVEAWMARVRS